MSLFDTFDGETREVLRAADTVAAIEGFPETVVVTFKPGIMDLAAQIPPAEVLDTMHVFFQLPVLKIRHRGRDLAVYQTLLGGAASVALLEECIARGGKRFVLFGSCGALDRELPPGHLVVPTAAYRDEGTSYHYLPAGDYVDLPTAARTAEILGELNIPHALGRIWSTDGLYRETRRNLAARKAEGCVAVDMECASMAAAARFRGVEFYQFLYTEDNLGGESWDPGLLGQLPLSENERYFNIALELAARVTPEKNSPPRPR